LYVLVSLDDTATSLSRPFGNDALLGRSISRRLD
jgi:hypothetical protein